MKVAASRPIGAPLGMRAQFMQILGKRLVIARVNAPLTRKQKFEPKQEAVSGNKSKGKLPDGNRSHSQGNPRSY